jgi:hypothetical protein
VITVACRDGGAWRLACACLPGLAAAALLAWALAPGFAPAGALAAAWVWRQGPPAAPRLGWDGRGWWLDGAPTGAPTIVLDLGGWMLLAFAGGGWAPLSAAAAGADWPALRAALHAGVAPADAPPRSRPP